MRIYWETGGITFSYSATDGMPIVESAPYLLVDHLVRQYQFRGIDREVAPGLMASRLASEARLMVERSNPYRFSQ